MIRNGKSLSDFIKICEIDQNEKLLIEMITIEIIVKIIVNGLLKYNNQEIGVITDF
jgi:hypothetical protein